MSEKVKRMKEAIDLKTAVWVCLLGICGIYALCVMQMPSYEPFFFWDGGFYAVYPEQILWKLKKLLVSVWPFLLYKIALMVKSKLGHGKTGAGRLFCYHLLAFAVIWALETGMVFSEFYRREPLETLYLSIMAMAVWRMSEADEGKDKSLVGVILPVALTVLLFWRHGRILDILSSLQNPVTSVNGMEEQVNWLGYRFALLLRGWRGDFSLMEERFAMRIPGSCPLAVVNAIKGPLAVCCVLALEVLLLHCIRMLIGRQGDGALLPKIVWTALICKSVLGILAELFLITSTDLGILILRNPGDMILLLYVLLSGSFNCEKAQRT